MNNSVVFNKIHMRNRIFNLHLFLSCLFIKSLVQKLLCLVLSWEQSKDVLEPSVGLACPELLLQGLTQLWHLHTLQRERDINIAGWEALLEFRAGKWQEPPPSRGSTLLSAASVTSRGFGHSQPRRFLWFRTSRTWHLQRWELHLTETLPPAFLMCPTDKPSTPATKMSLWKQNFSPHFKVYKRLQLIPIGNRQDS